MALAEYDKNPLDGEKKKFGKVGSTDTVLVKTAILDANGNQITSFGGSGGTSHADDAVFTIGSASSITPTGFLADETTPDSVDEGDVGVPRMTLARKPYAVISDPSAEQHAGVDASGHLQVDIAADSVGIGGGTQYTEGDVDASITGTALMGESSGDTLNVAQLDASKNLKVAQQGNINIEDVSAGTQTNDIKVTLDSEEVVLGTGSNAIGKLAANTGVDIGDVDVTSVPAPLNVTGGGTEASALRVTLANDSTGLLSVDDNGGSLTIDGTVTANAGTNLNTSALATSAKQLPDGHNVTVDNAAAGAAVNIQDGGNSITVDNPTISVVGGGAEATAQRVTIANDSTGVLSVDDNASSLTVDTTGTSGLEVIQSVAADLNCTEASAASILSDTTAIKTAVQIIDDWDNAASDGASMSGDTAHDAVDAGEPVKIGGKARTANPTAVSANDRVDAFFDDTGKQVVVNNAPRDLVTQSHTSISDANETTILAAGGAGVFHDITNLVITNSSNTAVTVDIRDDTASTVRAQFAIAPKGGIVVPFPTPWTQTAANDNWTAQSDTAVSTLEIFVQAVKNV